jgi:hypothetical protein
MAVVKIYDKVANKWVAVGTNEAVGVMTSNPELLKNGETETNVEDVLINMKDELTEVKNNLTYMATQGSALYWEEI